MPGLDTKTGRASGSAATKSLQSKAYVKNGMTDAEASSGWKA